jgi:hypothetical protein
VPEPPFTDREVQVLRGMIDDHLYRATRDQRWRKRLTVIQKAVIGLAAVYALAIPLLNLILTLKGR